MGEYEPNDSRNVTQSDHRAPGEPERTGPREGQARKEAQQAQQQQSGTQSQSQSSSLKNEDRVPGAPGEAVNPAQSNEPQAIRSPAGAPRPEYDQYEVNQPSNLNHQAEDRDAGARAEQARAQSDRSLAHDDEERRGAGRSPERRD